MLRPLPIGRRLRRRPLAVILLAAAWLTVGPARCRATSEGPIPFGSVAISRSHIAFAYAGRLWIVGRSGGEARQLTSLPLDRPDAEGRPIFSPEGDRVVFWRDSGGNVDLYVAPTAGGEARRLTFHPKEDQPLGWSADGRRVLFSSRRQSDRFFRLYTIPAEGGFEEELPLPLAEDGALSPDGTRIAYVPRWNSTRTWRNYRGGAAMPLWIASLADSRIVDKVPRTDSNDFSPQWIGETLYFLSDRTQTVNLFRYDTRRRTVTQLTHVTKFDIKSAAATQDAIVFVQHGALHLLDLESLAVRDVPVHVAADFPGVRARTVNAGRWIRSFDLSPDGREALFGARGEVLTLDLKSGACRNMTQTSGVAERSAAWSPDGRWIAYFSDAEGEYRLYVRPAGGEGPVRSIPAGALVSRPLYRRGAAGGPVELPGPGPVLPRLVAGQPLAGLLEVRRQPPAGRVALQSGLRRAASPHGPLAGRRVPRVR